VPNGNLYINYIRQAASVKAIKAPPADSAILCLGCETINPPFDVLTAKHGNCPKHDSSMNKYEPMLSSQIYQETFMPQIERMTIALPSEMATTVKLAVETGDYASNSEVFRDAIRVWQLKRQLEQEEVKHIRAAVQRGFGDLAAGRVNPAEEVFNRLEKKYRDMQ
jgi:antitoxin ParD1/3/4